MLGATRLMTLQEAMARWEREGAFEVYDGEIKPLTPPVMIHQWVIRILFRLLDAHCAAHELGEVIQEITFVILEQSQWVKGSRVPDISFISAARWVEYIGNTPDWGLKPLLIVPDLAIEVVSPGDSYADVQNKVDHYLNDGVRMLWVIDPQRATAGVYQGDRLAALKENDTLSGGDVVPGFSVALADLFKMA